MNHRFCALVAASLLLAAPPSVAGEARVFVRWLGVAGFSIASEDSVLLHDPYMSRPGMLRTLFSRYRPDTERLGSLLGPDSPAPEMARAGLLLIGQSHFDHLGDAPWLAARLGASVVGSATTANIARGYGLPEAQTRIADPGTRLVAGPFEIRVIESRHAEVLAGRVPLPGLVEMPPDGPIHAFSFKLGDARNYLITHRDTGLRILVSSSGGRHLPALEALLEEGVQVDLLLAAPQGRDERLADDLVRTLRPRRVVPHHYADFFVSLDDPAATEPRNPEDLAAFEAELHAAARAHGVEMEVRRMALFEVIELGE